MFCFNNKLYYFSRYVQVMTFEQAENWEFNPFDLTKVWPHKEFPLRQVGKLFFNRNPKNYFAEVEQLAFSPAHMVPGIEPSPDKMLQVKLKSLRIITLRKAYYPRTNLQRFYKIFSFLQGRLFSYNDTHRHRLGTNWQQIPVNCPYR